MSDQDGAGQEPGAFGPARGAEAENLSLEAATWFATLLEEDLPAAQREAFRDWYRGDPRHAAAFEQIESLWEKAGSLPPAALAEGLPARSAPGRAIPPRRRFLRAALFGGGAAGLAAAGLWSVLPAHPFADFQTGSGESRKVELPDGSRLELAAETAVSMAWTPTARRLRLHRGEAFFEVVADPGRPFTVAAASGTVRALGTAFGIAAQGEGARVLVTEHAVEVAFGQERRVLEAGASLSYGPDGLGRAEMRDPEELLSWRRGQLIFVSRPLGEVVEALAPWTRGVLLVPDAALAARPITLIVDIKRSEQILDTLAGALPLKLYRFGPLLTLILPA